LRTSTIGVGADPTGGVAANLADGTGHLPTLFTNVDTSLLRTSHVGLGADRTARIATNIARWTSHLAALRWWGVVLACAFAKDGTARTTAAAGTLGVKERPFGQTPFVTATNAVVTRIGALDERALIRPGAGPRRSSTAAARRGSTAAARPRRRRRRRRSLLESAFSFLLFLFQSYTAGGTFCGSTVATQRRRRHILLFLLLFLFLVAAGNSSRDQDEVEELQQTVHTHHGWKVSVLDACLSDLFDWID
jgi:hypothetical protein